MLHWWLQGMNDLNSVLSAAEITSICGVEYVYYRFCDAAICAMPKHTDKKN